MANDLGPLRIVRPDDLLNLTVELANLRVSADRRLLERVDPAAPAWLVVLLPPQHLSEQAFLEYKDHVEAAAPPPVKYVAAGPSRLVFELPEDAQSWPLDLPGLLDWNRLTPRLAGNALPPDATTGPALTPPAGDRTALEVPYRLLLSPDARARWVHRTEPFAAGGRYEVWHSVLRPDGTAEGTGTRRRPVPVRAIGFRNVGNSFTASLTTEDLDDLVTLSGDFGNRARSAMELGMPPIQWLRRMQAAHLWGRPIVPVPLRADHFAIGPLGADVRMQGLFDFPAEDQDPDLLQQLGVKTPSLQQYEHVIGGGRDQWVMVVRRGYLDTGQRASLVKVTYRSFEPVQVGTGNGPDGHYAIFGSRAYLRQFYQVVAQEQMIEFGPLGPGYTDGGREMPIRSLRLTTLVTPKLDVPSVDTDRLEQIVRITWQIHHPWGPAPDDVTIGRLVQEAIEAELDKPRLIEAGGAPVRFGLVANDWEGRRLTGAKAMLFIPYQVTRTPGYENVLAARFQEPGNVAARQLGMAGQTMAVADPAGAIPGSTAVPVDGLTLTLQPVTNRAGLPSTYLPHWVLSVAGLDVHLEAVERLTGSTAAVGATMHRAYLDRGLGMAANPAGSYLTLAAPLAVSLGGARGGGVAQPRATLEVVTSRQGALAASLAVGSVPAASLAGIFGGAKLFGTVDLWRILGDIPAPGPATVGLADLAEGAFEALLADPGRLVPIPVLRSRRVVRADGSPAVEARFVWKPVLRTDPELKPLIDVGDARLVLDSRTVTPLDGGNPEATVRGELAGFSLTFGGVVRVRFGRLVFLARPGRKADVSAEGVSVDFLGPLEFVNTIRDILPDNGFSDPPAISVTPEGITAGYSLGIPSVGVGVFSLQNLALSAMLSLPFVGKPAGLRFALSERQHPFLVTVTLFGGGGFFALGVSANGVEEIEAAIEFGGNVSLNLGVASGGVYVMAGVYFGKTAEVCVLTGYLRCGGYLSVLGLISVSLEFYLAFTWRRKAGGGSEVWGQASLRVSVSVCGFSKSVELSIERRFAGASGDPALEAVLAADDWQAYCLAFALEAAA